MRTIAAKLGVVVFVLAAVGCLAGGCFGEITEYGTAGNAEPLLQLQSFVSETAVSADGEVVLNFEDLPFVDGQLPSGYAGLEWDCYFDGDPIFWVWRPESADPTYSEPHSG